MTNRRQLLAAAVAAPIAIIPTTALAGPAMTCTSLEPSAQWYAAVAAMDAAGRAYDAFYTAIYEPAWKAACAEREALERQREIQGIPVPFPAIVAPAQIEAEHKRLEDANYAAFKRVADFEPTTAGDLIAKVEFTKSQEVELDPDQMLADLHRVFGGAQL